MCKIDLLEVCEPLHDDFKGNSSDEEYLEMKSKESVSLYYVLCLFLEWLCNRDFQKSL